MKNTTSTKACLLAAVLFVSALVSSDSANAQTRPPIRNIVLVHGAFADGSGWQAVYKRPAMKNNNSLIGLQDGLHQ